MENTKKREDLKVLLVQLREDESTPHEWQCVAKHTGLNPEQITQFDALEEGWEPSIVDEYDAVFIGGANAFRVSHNQPHNLEKLSELVRYCNEVAKPTFGLCYGAHLMAHALDGKVEYMPNQKEVSTYDMYTLPLAQDDPVFGDLPKVFPANCGRTDDIIELPITAVPFVNSDRVQFHAFKIAGKPLYATQFHAELDREGMIARMKFAFNHGGYYESEADLEKHIESVQDAPEATALLRKFIDNIVLK